MIKTLVSELLTASFSIYLQSAERMRTVLPEIEIAIARGYDIDRTRRQLTDRAKNDYQAQYDKINHEARVAELIMYVLQTEPTWSPGYAAARGLQKRLRQEHPVDDEIVRELRKAAWMDDDDNVKKGENNHDSNDKGTATGPVTRSSNDGDGGKGEGNSESLPPPISE